MARQWQMGTVICKQIIISIVIRDRHMRPSPAVGIGRMDSNVAALVG